MKARERAVTLLIQFLNHKDDALKNTLQMMRVCKLLCTVTCPHKSNKTLLGKLKWTVSLSASRSKQVFISKYFHQEYAYCQRETVSCKPP